MQLSPKTRRFFLALVAFAALLTVCVQHFSPIMAWLSGALSAVMPFIVGACFAFVLSVPMRLFDHLLSRKVKGKPLLADGPRRPVSLALALLLMALLLSLLIVIVVPQLVDTVSSLANSVTRLMPAAQKGIADLRAWLAKYPDLQQNIAPYIPDVSEMASGFIAWVQRNAGLAMGAVVSRVSSLFGQVTDVLIAFVFAVYVLLQKETLGRQCRRLLYAFLPRFFCDEALRVASMAHRTFFSYVTIQFAEAGILGGLCFIGMLILRFPYALVISVIMLFCALIPIYGAIISCVVGAFLVLIESPPQAIWFVVFILVLQQIETNLIYPRVVSTSINLPSMWVLMVVTAGGGIFGLAGMLLAVPVTSVIYTMLGEATRKRLDGASASSGDTTKPKQEDQTDEPIR